MKRVWHRSHPELLQKVRAEIGERYPDLTVFVEGDAVRLRGSFPVEHEGKVLDRFQVEVELPPEWPDVTPILRETGGRIPHHEDRHGNRNGDTCPIVPEEWQLNPERESLLAFLDGPVRNFFIGQSLVEQGQPWPFGERLHGKPGLLQAYGEWFGTTDERAIRLYLEYLTRRELKGHWDCPCGKGKRLRNCHLSQVQELRNKIPPNVAAAALKALKK